MLGDGDVQSDLNLNLNAQSSSCDEADCCQAVSGWLVVANACIRTFGGANLRCERF